MCITKSLCCTAGMNTIGSQLGKVTMNKARGDGIPDKLFKILKDDALKCCTQYVSKFYN